jgi:membrane protease YdiL (CAAX protease family)
MTKLSLRWLFLAWFSLVFTVAAFVVPGMIMRGDPTEWIARTFGETAVFAIMMWIVGTMIAVLILGVLLRRNGLGREDIGLKGRLTKKAGFYALLGWFVAFWLFYIVQVVGESVGIGMFWRESRLIRPDSPLDWATILLGPVLIASVAEEIIYRGYVLGALLPRLSTRRAVTLSALIFASVHVAFGPGMMVYIFLGAFIPAYLYVKFENIYPCILMHFLNNVVAYVVIPLVFL